MHSLTAYRGPTCLSAVIFVEESHRAHDLGAAVVQDKTVSICFEATSGNTHGVPLPPIENDIHTHPMKNFLLSVTDFQYANATL